ncbi:MAG: endonuclease III, partial [Nanoarchaeota archaeon]
MKKKNIEKTMNILSEIYFSNEKTTLNRMRKKPDAFKILISCLLSLRTQDKNTEKASRRLFEVVETPKGILDLPLEELEKL